MRRRDLLATAALTPAGAVSGCIGSGAEDGSPSDEQPGDDADERDDPSSDGTYACTHEPLSGRFQWRYDACNSGYAAGMSAPTEAPEFQRLYRGSGAPPLTADGSLFTETWAAEIGGDTQWEVGESAYASRNAALYEDSIIGIGTPFDGVWAISVEDGDKQWDAELSPGPIGPLYPDDPLTIQGDRAYYATMTGVGCVDLAAQEEAWVADLDAELPYGVMDRWYAPAVTSSHVFALTSAYGSPGSPERDWEADPRQLYVLDLDTGELEWTVELAPEEMWITAAPIVGDGLVFVKANVDAPDQAYDSATRVIAVDPAAREVAWRQTLPVGDAVATPAAANGRFYVLYGEGGYEYDIPFELAALDTADGSVRWRAEPDTNLVVPTITDGAIVACDGNSLRALDPETGDARWEIDLVDRVIDRTDIEGSFDWRSPFVPVVHDGRVFVYLGADRIAEFA